MKLTEAQLKHIIEEEVQLAIEEGIFGDIGRGIAGVGKYVGGQALGAASSAAKKAGAGLSKAGSAAVAGLGNVATGIDTGFKTGWAAVEKGAGELTQAALKSVYSGKVRDLETDLPNLIDNLQAGETSTGEFGLGYGVGGYTELIEKVHDIIKQADDKIKDIKKAKEEMKKPLTPKKVQGPVGPMDAPPTPEMVREQVDAITEAIMKRISQKR